MHFIGQAKIVKILKLRNNNIICEYLLKTACPACPVAPADGTGVAPEDGTGASYLT